MGNDVKNIVDDKRRVKNQLGDTTNDVQPIYKRFRNNASLFNPVVIVETKSVVGSFIVGSSSYGIVGESEVGSNDEDKEPYVVLPYNNKYKETFGSDVLIDTENSTGTLNTDDQTYTFENGDVLQSKTIAKLRGPINSALFRSHDDLSGKDVTISLSNDGGETWMEITPGETHTFSTSSDSDELKYKIEASEDVTITKPLKIEVNN